MSGLVVLDRDGTLIEERPYLADPAGVILLPHAAEGLRALSGQGFHLAVATNQSGVGRGYFGLEAVERVNRRLCDLLARESVTLDGFYICPHHPDEGCGCRKPGTGLLERAARAADASPAESFVVGDKECDIEIGAPGRGGYVPGPQRLGPAHRAAGAGAAQPTWQPTCWRPPT